MADSRTMLRLQNLEARVAELQWVVEQVAEQVAQMRAQTAEQRQPRTSKRAD
jgi:hypothetical protein